MSEMQDLMITIVLGAVSIGVCLVILRRFPVTRSSRCVQCGAETELLTEGLCDDCDATWNRNSPRYTPGPMRLMD